MSQSPDDPVIPSQLQPAAGIIGPFQRFFKKLVSGSYPLFLAAIFAILKDKVPQGLRIFLSAFLNEIECDNVCGDSILMNRRHLNAVQAIDLAGLNVETPLQRLEHSLQSWIAHLVLPLFALANSGLVLKGIDFVAAIGHPVTLGVLGGLVLGKPLGISLFTYTGSRLLQAPLMPGIKRPQILGISLLGGIGFTMSLFMSGLSFSTAEFLDFSKLGIIAGSIISGTLGMAVLKFFGRPEK